MIDKGSQLFLDIGRAVAAILLDGLLNPAVPQPGDKAICKMCGKEIIYVVGPYWDHIEISGAKPRHPAWPKESEM